MTDMQKTILVAAAAAVLGFAIGALWQYTSARGYAQRLDRSEQELTFKRLEAQLGAATIEAQRGSHEIGRQLASEFFTGLQASLQDASPAERGAFAEILSRRDAMITALSRSDPQSGPMLAQLFTRFRIARGETVGPTDDVNSRAPSPDAPAAPDTPAAPRGDTGAAPPPR